MRNKCEYCNRFITPDNKTIRIITNTGKIQSISFDTYDCYLKFWKNTPNFIPLKQFVICDKDM